MTSNNPSNLRSAKIPLNFGMGAIPALGFGTLIPDPAETRSATTNALRIGFRHFDCAERYRNEREVGDSLRTEIANRAVAREDHNEAVEYQSSARTCRTSLRRESRACRNQVRRSLPDLHLFRLSTRSGHG